MANAIYNFSNTVPAAPAGSQNIIWQFDASNPINLSGYVPLVSSLWSNLGNAAGNLILSNAGFTTTFNQTSSVVWTWANTTSSTGYATQKSSPVLTIAGTYWTGVASAVDSWAIQNVLTTNTPTDTLAYSQLTFTHTGAAGAAQMLLPPGSVGNPGIAFNNDATTGLFNLGAGQLVLSAAGTRALTASTITVEVTVNQLTFSAGQGCITQVIDPNMNPCVNFNPGTGTIASIGLTQIAGDLTTSSWSATQAGRMYYNKTLNVVKVWDGVELNTLAPTRVKSNLTAQSAAITATTIYAVPANMGGEYRITWSASITTADGVSSTLGGATGFQAKYTNLNDSVVKTSNPTTANISAGNTTATTIGGVVTAYCKESTNLQYLFGYTSNTPGQMIYDLNIYVEYLG